MKGGSASKGPAIPSTLSRAIFRAPNTNIGDGIDPVLVSKLIVGWLDPSSLLALVKAQLEESKSNSCLSKVVGDLCVDLGFITENIINHPIQQGLHDLLALPPSALARAKSRKCLLWCIHCVLSNQRLSFRGKTMLGSQNSLCDAFLGLLISKEVTRAPPTDLAILISNMQAARASAHGLIARNPELLIRGPANRFPIEILCVTILEMGWAPEGFASQFGNPELFAVLRKNGLITVETAQGKEVIRYPGYDSGQTLPQLFCGRSGRIHLVSNIGASSHSVDTLVLHRQPNLTNQFSRATAFCFDGMFKCGIFAPLQPHNVDCEDRCHTRWHILCLSNGEVYQLSNDPSLAMISRHCLLRLAGGLYCEAISLLPSSNDKMSHSNLLALACNDGMLRTVDAVTGAMIFTCAAASNDRIAKPMSQSGCISLEWFATTSISSRKIETGDFGEPLRLWSLHDGHLLTERKLLPGVVASASFVSVDGEQLLATCSKNGVVDVFRYDGTAVALESSYNFNDELVDIQCLPSSGGLLVADKQGNVHVLDFV